VTAPAPMRVLLHVDSDGAVSLLSSVMMMQEKETDPDVAPEQVLVIDETKIPFFEGIEERGGKKVGIRMDTTDYDMPRKIDTTEQSALLDDVVAASTTISSVGEVTDKDLENFINSRSARPVELEEAYFLRWELEGRFGNGLTVKTPDGAPLLLDPFHRSNPFRHAFHPQHAAGYAIERALTITFDIEQPASRLIGSYEETLSGLAASDITLSGIITLTRISEEGELQ